MARTRSRTPPAAKAIAGRPARPSAPGGSLDGVWTWAGRTLPARSSYIPAFQTRSSTWERVTLNPAPLGGHADDGHVGRIRPWWQRQAWTCLGHASRREYRQRDYGDPPQRRGRGRVDSRYRSTPWARYRHPYMLGHWLAVVGVRRIAGFESAIPTCRTASKRRTPFTEP